MKARLGLLLTAVVACLILYSCMSQEQQEQVLQNSEPQSVNVTVNVGGDTRAERFLGTFDQISRLSLDIDRNYGNKRVLTDFPLVNDGSKWTGTINNLIVGFDYTITGHAYKNDNVSDNTSFLEIFRGDTQHTVTEGTNSLNLRLAPLLDDRELTVPRITRINRPFQMLASTSGNITVVVDTVKKDGSSAVDATLSYRFRSVDNESLPLDNITGGSFSPGEGDVTKSGSSYQDILTTYTAPDNDSNMKLQVRVSNELEIGVTTHFNVYVTDDIQTQNTVDTNPVIENINAERLDNGDLKWSMNVSNDDGFSGLKVKWEYLFGEQRTFIDNSSTPTSGNINRGVMQSTISGYQDSDDGMLLVTVCEDGDLQEIPDDCAYMNEASTSLSFELIPNAYQVPVICDNDEFCGTLSDSVISELESDLTSTSSSSNSRSASRSASRVLNTSLSSSQITLIVDSARQSVSEAGLSSSVDLIQLLPKIIEGTQTRLSSIGLSDSSEAINVINVIVNSMVKSVNGRSEYLPSTSADNGATATETIFKKITSTSVSNLDEAGLSSTDIGQASSELVGTVVGSLGSGGISSAEIGGVLEKITASAVDSLDQISGFDVTSLGGAIDNITGGATAALGDIDVIGFSADNLSTMVEKVTSGATGALGKIEMAGFSADNLSSMVEKVAAGATGALGKIQMIGYEASDLSGMVEKVTAGATGAMGNIQMVGFDASHLSGMMEKVTAGATGALGKIEMTGFSADNLPSMVEKVTAGATGALGNIQMTGFSADNLSGMMEKVTAGATGALGNIQMTGFSADNLSGMMEKVTAGATGAMGNIQMVGFDATHLTGMMEKVTAGATGAMGNIAMTGFDASHLSGMMEKVTAGATGALGNIQMEGFSADNISAMVTQVTAGATGALGNIQMDGFSADNISAMVTQITAGATGALGNIQMTGFSAPVSVVISNSATVSGITYTSSNLEWQIATASETDGLSSGLTWLSDQVRLNWADGVSYCTNLNLNSQTDWRLPTKEEIASLIDTTVSAPKIVSVLVATTQLTYWSFTPYETSSTKVWYFHFSHGTMSNAHKSEQKHRVRCVRGGE